MDGKGKTFTVALKTQNLVWSDRVLFREGFGLGFGEASEGVLLLDGTNGEHCASTTQQMSPLALLS